MMFEVVVDVVLLTDHHQHHYHHRRCGNVPHALEAEAVCHLACPATWALAMCQLQIAFLLDWLMYAMLFVMMLRVVAMMLLTMVQRQWQQVTWMAEAMQVEQPAHNELVCLCLYLVAAKGNHCCDDLVNHTFHSLVLMELLCSYPCPCLCPCLYRSILLRARHTPATHMPSILPGCNRRLANHRSRSRHIGCDKAYLCLYPCLFQNDDVARNLCLCPCLFRSDDIPCLCLCPCLCP